MQKPYIIAEVGVNHNGSFKLATKSVIEAAKCGANAVKFQSFDADEFMSKGKEFYSYKTKNGTRKEEMYKMFKRLEFPYDWYKKLFKICKKYNVDFFSTAGNEESAYILNKLKVKFIKIASPDLTNYPLLKYVASLGRKTIVSTGMGDAKEIDQAVRIFKRSNTPLCLLHCVSLYPTPDNEAKILRILKLRERYKGLEIGYSDHTTNYLSAVVATAFGVNIFEKHFTLNKSLSGPDHLISSSPKEFRKYIKNIKLAKIMLGKKQIDPSKREKLMRVPFRRSITAKSFIKKGDIFTKKNLTLKRPQSGLHPSYFSKVIGKKSKFNLKIDHKITKRYFK